MFDKLIGGEWVSGKTVAAVSALRMRRFQLEMGGKNPLVVLDDTDLDKAIAAALDSLFATGQRCTASSRLIVTQGIGPRENRAPMPANSTALSRQPMSMTADPLSQRPE